VAVGVGRRELLAPIRRLIKPCPMRVGPTHRSRLIRGYFGRCDRRVSRAWFSQPTDRRFKLAHLQPTCKLSMWLTRKWVWRS